MADSFRHPYSTTRNSAGEVGQKPLLPIQLAHAGANIEALGLLDSGATVSVLPDEIATKLGLDWESAPPVQLSGNLSQHEARGVLVTGQVATFPPKNLVFAWSRMEGVPLILGQTNFFVEFDVCFYRSRFEFEVRPTGR